MSAPRGRADLGLFDILTSLIILAGFGCREVRTAALPGKVTRVIRWTAEGQFAPEGKLPEMASLGSKGHLAAVIRLDDDDNARNLALGEAGAAAIYTQPAGPFHVISKIYLRMISLTFYLPF